MQYFAYIIDRTVNLPNLSNENCTYSLMADSQIQTQLFSAF